MFNIEDVPKLVEKVLSTGKPLRHKYYPQTVVHAEQMGVHVEGRSPDKLLKQKRPNEPADIEKYRLEVWKNVTESLADKALHTISKIFDPKIFRVTFPENPPIIPDDESLENYIYNNFGVYKSIWVFIRETLLTKEMSDPNSLCVVMPRIIDPDDTNYTEPVPFIFKSEYLIDFIEDEYYILWVPKPRDKHDKHPQKGELWVITDEFIRCYYVNTSKDIKIKIDLETGFLPAFRLGGTVQGDRSPYWYKSFISGVQPHWDKVVTMTSDLDGSIVSHLFPTPWEWTIECNDCNGSGHKEVAITNAGKDNAGKTNVLCNTCEGTGRVTAKSPFGSYQIKRDAIDQDAPIPNPPAGFITKDIEPIRELTQLRDAEALKGFEAINMDILNRIGENQSGIAKVIDRTDLESFLMRIAQHVFDCNVEPIVEYVARWRYQDVLSPQQLDEYIDGVTVSKPKDFSVLGVNMLMEEYQTASSTNVSDNYLRHLESEIVNTRFSNNEEAKKKNLTIIQLKPFPSKTDDEVSLGVANGTIKKITAIRNSNVDDLVTIAMEENDEFLDLEFSEKLTIVNGIIEREFADENVNPEGIPVDGGTTDIT